MNPTRAIRSGPALPALPAASDYELLRRDFTWERARTSLDGLPGGGLNIAHEAVDRHAVGEAGGRVALRVVGGPQGPTELTYRALRDRTSQFADLLDRLDVGRGERVFTLLGRLPELYVAALGTLRHGSVLSPLFSAFGPEPIRERMHLGDARVLVTTPALYRRKVEPVRDSLPGLRHVLVVGDATGIPGSVELSPALDMCATDRPVARTGPEDVALLHFTSGTTGTPKGAVHVHGAVLAHHVTARYALDLHRDDVFWCTADPGWVTGTSYGIIAPLTHGVTMVSDVGEFDAKRWYRNLTENAVTVWYTAPTALRMLMRYGEDLPHRYDLSRLRYVASVGEPLNPEVVLWGERVLGLPVHDNWWQTETGAIMVSNYAFMPVRPGSMGRPMPGVETAVLERGPDGRARVVDGAPVQVAAPDVEGELALRRGWPSMFRGYLHEEARYARCFAGDWYLTGDVVRCDAEGYLWFVGRADDVIKSAGHLIGPFEVESTLMEHPAVAEAGVIGVPDQVAGELVKAFVTLRPGWEPTDELRLELLGFGRKRLGGLAPKEIAFDQNLPHTRSGKIMRRLLRARELGLPEGDISTLEGTS
jgi:acetyl-CoA synthetase